MSCNYIIKRLRVENFYTQQQIADIVSVGQKTYSDYELGYTRIPLDILIILAKFYNVDMNYICGVSNVRNCFPTSEIS